MEQNCSFINIILIGRGIHSHIRGEERNDLLIVDIIMEQIKNQDMRGSQSPDWPTRHAQCFEGCCGESAAKATQSCTLSNSFCNENKTNPGGKKKKT